MVTGLAALALRQGLLQREHGMRLLGDSRRRTYVLAGALVAVLAIAHRVGLGAPVFPVDDAYITLHNAQVLLSGHDPSFPGASALTGATSSVHLALVALCSVPFGARSGLYLAMWLGVLVYATGIVRLAFAWRATPSQAFLLLVLGLFVARVPHQLLNGLETGLALGGVTWALALASEPGRERALAALCGVLPFLRPELGVLSLGLVGVKAWPLWREGRRREIGTLLLFGAAGAAPWVVWSLIATGAAFPSTAGAKAAWFAEGHLPGNVKRQRIGNELSDFAGTIGIVLATGVALAFSWVGRVVLGFAAVFVAFYYVYFPGALGHYEQRYLYVLLPGVVLGLAWALSRSRLWRIAALVLLAAGLTQSAFAFGGRWDHYIATRHFTTSALASVAGWANENIPHGATVMVHDAGFISYATDFRKVDMVGLKTPRVIHFNEQLTGPSAGALRGEAINRIALQEHPQYLIVLNGWDSIFQITGALRSHGWRVDLRRSGDYSVYALAPPPVAGG